MTGVTMPSSTVLSVTWPWASTLPLPGGHDRRDEQDHDERGRDGAGEQPERPDAAQVVGLVHRRVEPQTTWMKPSM